MSDQKPKVQWCRCGECDPETNGYKLTVSPIEVPRFGLFLPSSAIVVPLFFRDGNWWTFEHDMHNCTKPSHWAAIVDEEPVGTFQFKLDWVKACDHPPPAGGVVVWSSGHELRLALFGGSKWAELPGYREIEPPDWWASRRAAIAVRRSP